jgi:hypothetical protein
MFQKGVFPFLVILGAFSFKILKKCQKGPTKFPDKDLLGYKKASFYAGSNPLKGSVRRTVTRENSMFFLTLLSITFFDAL